MLHCEFTGEFWVLCRKYGVSGGWFGPENCAVVSSSANLKFVETSVGAMV
jgi:hypothetical protein